MSTRNKIKGFTLVEMAIVVIIFGLGLASFSHVVDLYRKTTAINETTTSIAEITDYIGAFRELYGRYPCPASMTDTRDEANYGREDCSDMTAIAPGNCTADNGICIEQSTRSYDFEDPYTGATGVRPSRTRVGFIPFRQLNLAEDQAYDGYDHRIAYVVTEHLTDSDTFQPGGGGIDIIDDTGGSALEAAATAHFLIFSHGENGEGAYTLDGNRSPCAATAAEAQNCDLSANAIYSLLQTGTSGEADNYDDVMSFFTQKDLPLWQMSDATGQEDHAHVKNPGKVGFGVDDESAVSEELQIGNALRVVDDPQTTPVEGKIKAQNICDYNGTTGNCFAPSKIAGEIVQGEGMPCPSGTYMKGIANSAPICEPEVVVKCPTGHYMKGLDSNGKPVCDVPPPAGCPNQDVTLTCNGTPHTRTLFKAKHGETQTVTAGFSLKRTFQCNNGVWNEIGSQTGLCDCVEDKTKKINKNLTCAVNSDCGARYTGTKDTQSQFLCPAAAWSTVVVKDECACAETFKETSGSCPNGFNKGQINYKNTHICTGTPRCSGKVEVSRTCECVADRTEEPRWCDNGYTGQYKVEKLFKCQSDKTKPGAWTPNWTEVAGHTKADNCKCVPEKLADQNVSCPVGYEGKIVVHTERICEGGSIPKVIETGRTNTCKLIEPVRCKWDDQGTSIGSGSSPKAYLVNQSCECGVDTTAQCSKAAGNDNFKHYFCTCGS